MIAALAAAGLLTLAAAGPAKKPAPLAELKRDFAGGELERVIKKADAALKAGLDPKDAAQVQLWRGQALLGLGKEAQARAAFTSAVEAWGDVELDAQRASPDALRVFEQARSAVPATLSVVVTGGDGTVLIDGKDYGPAPLVIQLAAGAHVVDARGAGQLRARSDVMLQPGRRREVELQLQLPPPPPPEPKAEVKPDARPAPPVVVAPPKAEPPPPQGSSKLWLAPFAGGVVLGAVGGILLWQARVAYDLLNGSGPPLTAEQESSAMRNGPTFQTFGFLAVGVGVAAVVSGVVMFMLTPPSSAQAQARAGFFAVPGGGGVLVTAPLP
ncbi:MAG: hypothetical protein JNK82_12850 [Myxococcaceae bacterium]|nr:hypothetical protein [Myxococcaceae bacterium]